MSNPNLSRSTPQNPEIHPVQHPPPNEVSPLLDLRRQWRWAAVCQFLHTFRPLIALEDVTATSLEHDLIFSTLTVVPPLMHRLLYTLSQDKKISTSNWESFLSKQFLKRDPVAYSEILLATSEPTPGPSLFEIGLAAEDLSSQRGNSPNGFDQIIQWSRLSLHQRLYSVHSLMEWHFYTPGRIRHLMKVGEEDTSWRIEPVGYDSKHNAYWLIGLDRLWVQRQQPKREPTNRKRKVTTTSAPRPEKSKRLMSVPNPNTKNASKWTTCAPEGKTRAAKTEANFRLHRQSQLAAITQKEMTHSKKPQKFGCSGVTPPTGPRLRSRLKGGHSDDWQQVPAEWLEAGTKLRDDLPIAVPVFSFESGDESELTELSDSDSEISCNSSERPVSRGPFDSVSSPFPGDPEFAQPGFVEWETICVTIEEWEKLTASFENSSSYTERALFRVLSVDLIPVVITIIRESLKQKQKEESIAQRKRSSRLALKQSEKDEARAAAARKAAEEERAGRQKRVEARAKRGDESRSRRDFMRSCKGRKEWESSKTNDHEPSYEQPSLFQREEPRFTDRRCDVCGTEVDLNAGDPDIYVRCYKCSQFQHAGCVGDVPNLFTDGGPSRRWSPEHSIKDNRTELVHPYTASTSTPMSSTPERRNETFCDPSAPPSLVDTSRAGGSQPCTLTPGSELSALDNHRFGPAPNVYHKFAHYSNYDNQNSAFIPEQHYSKA